MYTAVETFNEDVGSQMVERFETDNRPFLDDDNVASRMMSPTDCLSFLRKEGEGRFDLCVKDGALLNLHEEGGNFYIAPKNKLADDSVNGQRVMEHLAKRPMKVSLRAKNQLCKLMGVTGGYNRYKKMDNPSAAFMRDFRSFFYGESPETKLILRTNCDRKNNYFVEGVLSPKEDRVDSGRIVAMAMRSVLKNWGDCLRGVEVIRSGGSGGTSSFRLLFGDPVLHENKVEPTKRIYPMVDLMLSDTHVVKPEAALGLWRLWCLNGCTARDFDLATFKMDSSSSIDEFTSNVDRLVEVAFPFSRGIASRLGGLQNQRLAMEPKAIIDQIHGRGLIGNGYAEDLDEMCNAHGDVETEFDMFNMFTDAAKLRGKIASRRGMENKGLQFALADGGFSGVAQTGFNRSEFIRNMRSFWASEIDVSVN